MELHRYDFIILTGLYLQLWYHCAAWACLLRIQTSSHPDGGCRREGDQGHSSGEYLPKLTWNLNEHSKEMDDLVLNVSQSKENMSAIKVWIAVMVFMMFTIEICLISVMLL